MIWDVWKWCGSYKGVAWDLFWPYSWGTISFVARKPTKITVFQAFRVRKPDTYSRNHTSRPPLATKLWETSSNGEKQFPAKFQVKIRRGGPTDHPRGRVDGMRARAQ